MSVTEYRLEAGVGKPNTFWVATANGYNLIVYPDRVVINPQIAGEHLLVAAADRIRDLAACPGIVDGPWRYYHEEGIVSVAGPDWAAVCTDADDNAEWITALSPAVAPDLSALLVALHEREYDAARVIAQRLAHTLAPDLVEEDQK